MSWLSDDERALLARVIEIPPDVNRRNVPGLKPLSLYSSELKNLKQVASVLALAAAGQPLSDNARTCDRYQNTLETHGVVDATGHIPTDNEGARVVLQFKQMDDGTKDFWQQHADEIETPLFRAQVQRLLSGEGAFVNEAWRRAFWHAQQTLEHIPESDLEATLSNPSRLEVLQYIHSVGTEPWRYFRLPSADRSILDGLILRIRNTAEDAVVDPASPIEAAAKAYGQAMQTVQRDIRFRVAGFFRAFVTTRKEFGADFPRAFPDLSMLSKHDVEAGIGLISKAPPPFVERASLILPLQTIVSGCPGSGKSYFAQSCLTPETKLFRCQFHAETSLFDFIGSYKPSPIYENTQAKMTDAVGAPFHLGRPMIDYRFLPGPFTLALVAAYEELGQNVVLLVEEVNRANAPAVFGEMFQLLDRDESGFSRYGVTPQPELTAYLRTKGVLTEGQVLRLPPNLYIWGTMNSADQGVFPLDTAFRRRWSYRYLGHGEACEYPPEARRVRWGGRLVDWEDLRRNVNERLIKLGVHEDKLVGAYFLTREQLTNPDDVLNKLLLYLWDDVLRFRQHELFSADSFSQVASQWQHGDGAPLTGIEILEAPVAEGTEIASASPVEPPDLGEKDGAAGS